MRPLREYIEELKSLDQNNIGSWPLWAYGAAMTVVSLVIVLISAWYFVLPKRTDLEHAEAQEAALRQRYEERAAQVANLDAYRQQLVKMRADFTELLDQLPSQTEVPSLLRDISQARSTNGLNEELFKPLPEVKQEFYAELPNELVVTGGFHEFGQFVSDVAALSRIVTLDNVTIEPVTNTRSSGSSNSGSGSGSGNDKNSNPGEGPTLRMSLTATTYRYLEPGERPTPEPAKAAAK